MDNSKYHLQIVATEACKNRMIEAIKGIGQREIKGDTNDYFYFLQLVLIK